MLDAPCGDFNWMKVVLPNISPDLDYIGMDIVPDLIRSNRHKHTTRHILFKTGDITRDLLPNVDLVFNRDCLIHLSFSDIRRAIANFKASGSTYLMSSCYPRVTEHRNVVSGRWRDVNLELPPFNFPTPLRYVKDNDEDPNDGKVMGLWRIADLP